MKTKVFILTIISMLLLVKGFAAKNPTMSVLPVESHKAMVTCKTDDVKQLDFMIKDERGALLFHEEIGNGATDFRKIFNFSELDNGTYTLSLNCDNCTIYRDLIISGRKLKVGEEVRAYEPVFRSENEKVYLNFLNPSKGNVSLSIYGNGERITRRYLGNQFTIQKCFDLSKMESGDYEFVLSDRYSEHLFTVKK